MIDAPAPITAPPTGFPTADGNGPRYAELATLLEHWQQSGAKKRLGGITSPANQTLENCLVQVRLGVASSLFVALRCKHAPTASHSLRVALGCSAWAMALDLPREEREAVEVAALLHDIGKLGVPDRVLLKPGPLTNEELLLMDRYRQMTIEILTACCASPLVMTMAQNASSWYDGSRPYSNLVGENIPLGSRLIAIMDAFDAMTCGQIYRPALSHERAVAQLFEFAGKQFDPRLVRGFAEMRESDLEQLQSRMAAQWLQELDSRGNTATCHWQLAHTFAEPTPLVTESLFQKKLLDNMYDGVVFLDNNLQITLWNHGAERLTGIEPAAICNRQFHPSLLSMRDEKGYTYSDDECPVAHALQSGVQSLLRASIRGRNGREVTIDAHLMPVVNSQGTVHGVTLLLHDASPEASLEERCQRLHEKAIRDPLTQVANRAEFDRVHGLFIETHTQRGLACSLIICDIDRFKRINDTFGHPAGDEVIKSFAQLLKSCCRSGDLVARYGGEEFVMLCADCGIGPAFERAEMVRRAFAELSQPALGGNCVTASFGATQTQAGDTPEIMLNRADRALLMAKESGRNMVVQLGAAKTEEVKRRPWWKIWQPAVTEPVLEQYLVTLVPIKVAIEKLRGFIADHEAQVESIEESRVSMQVQGDAGPNYRRSSDRPVALMLELSFAEQRCRNQAPNNSPAALATPAITQTKIRVTARPRRSRDRRRANAVARARQLLASLRSYLMATEDYSPTDENLFRKPGK